MSSQIQILNIILGEYLTNCSISFSFPSIFLLSQQMYYIFMMMPFYQPVLFLCHQLNQFYLLLLLPEFNKYISQFLQNSNILMQALLDQVFFLKQNLHYLLYNQAKLFHQEEFRILMYAVWNIILQSFQSLSMAF